MKSLLSAALAAALAAGTLAAPAAAVTYNAFDYFDGTNPSGPYSFGSIDAGLSTFTAIDTSGYSLCATGLACLLQGVEPALGFYKNITGAPLTAFGTVDVPADALFFHPGPTRLAALAFTAPTTSTYRIDLGLALLSNSTITGTVVAFGRVTPSGIEGLGTATLDASSPSTLETGPLFLNAGDTVFVAVGPDGDYTYDSTQVIFNFTAVPEPQGWALLIAGFGLTGAVLRRRRALTAA